MTSPSMMSERSRLCAGRRWGHLVTVADHPSTAVPGSPTLLHRILLFFPIKCFDSKTSSKDGLTKSLQPVQRGCKQSNTPAGEQTGGGAR